MDPSTIKGIRDGSGAVFDIKDSYYERFLDNYDHIKKQEGSRLDFVVKRCDDLPELEEDESNFAGGNGRRYNDH